MRVEEQFEDFLKSVETGIIRVYREHPDLTDYSVIAALEAAVAHYKAIHQHRVPKAPTLPAKDAQVLQSIREVCDRQLGQVSLNAQLPAKQPRNVEEVLSCLRRLFKSAQFWNKERGRQGYLDFVRAYV